jgi:hypothetical protein
MITLLYPLLDWDAATVAIRTNVLAVNKNIKLYVVPRHAGYNREIVMSQLAKSSKLFFIVCNAKTIDANTMEELSFFNSRRRSNKIIAFIPKGMRFPEALNADVYRYDITDKDQLSKIILDYINNKSVSNALETGLAILLLSILLFGGNETKKKKARNPARQPARRIAAKRAAEKSTKTKRTSDYRY